MGWNKTFRHPVFVVAVISVVATLCCVCVSSSLLPSPEGRFKATKVSTLGIAYYELRKGQVHLISPYGPRMRDGFHTNYLGIYKQSGSQWTYTTTSGDTFLLKPGLLSLRFSEPDGS